MLTVKSYSSVLENFGATATTIIPTSTNESSKTIVS
jgi:hypothetical protein